MNHEISSQQIQQHVLNEIGRILVDKSEIHEDSSFKDLMLDEDDVNDLYDQLQSDFGIVFAPDDRAQAISFPEKLTLSRLVKLILELTNPPQKSGKGLQNRSKE